MSTGLTPEILSALCDEAEEHVRLGGFANSQTWIQACPPTAVLVLLDKIADLERVAPYKQVECIEETRHMLDGSTVRVRHTAVKP